MSEAPRKEIPRPKGDDDFEDLVLALMRAVWQDASAKLNGRRGQRQRGVDIYGTDHHGGSWRTGVQCKQHGSAVLVGDDDLVRELRTEVKKAKLFLPPLHRFVLATTAKRSAPVQQKARQITARHEQEGLFAVDVLAWEDIEDLLRQHPQVLAWYLGDRLPDVYGPWSELVGSSPPRDWERPFVGRGHLRATVLECLRASDSGFLLLTGPPGIGKTRFVEHLAASLPSELPELTGPPVVTFYFWRADRRTTPPVQCLKTVYYTLGRKHSLFTRKASDIAETLANQLANLFEELSREKLAGTGSKEVVILDGLDEAEDPARALQLLPKRLPKGVFLVLSSRPGAHTEGFESLPGATRIEIDPLSPKNLADAVQLLRLELPSLSPGTAEAVALALRGNFLVLTLFARHAQTRGLRAHEALEAARGLGRTEDLQAIYAAFWRYLQEDLAGRTAADADAALELVGLLSAVFEPVTRDQACRFLGKAWSGARLDRLLGSIRPFVEVRREDRGLGQARHETLELFHDTFDEFVQERLRPDLAGIHERVVESYAGPRSRSGGLTRLDDYGLRHLIRHALAANPRQALRLLTPELIRHKRQVLGSAVPVVEDLELGIAAAVQEDDLASTVLFGQVKGWLLQAESLGTTAAELILRVRLGEENLAWAKLDLLDPHAQTLVVAEIALRHPEGEGARSLELASHIEALALAAAPEVVEEVAVRLALAHPGLALRLAARVPEPHDLSANLEEPTAGRCLMRIFARLAGSDPDEAVRIAAQLGKDERVYALFAVVGALLGPGSGRAFAVLDEILGSGENEEQASAFTSQALAYLLLRLPDLDAPARGDVLLSLLTRFPHMASTWGLAFSTEEWLDRAPEEWKDLLARQLPGPGRDFLRWRLAETGHLPPPEPEEVEQLGLRDLAFAERIARVADEDPARAAVLTRKASWRWGAAPLRASARVAERLWERDPERASVLCFVALASKDADPGETDFGGYLDALRAIVPIARPLRARAIRLAFGLADRLKTLRTPGRVALARVLAQAVAQAGGEGAALFRSLLAEQEEEPWRRRIGAGILHNLRGEAVPSLAAALEASGRLGERGDGEATLEPDTHARLLAVAASRLLESDPDQAARMLRLAAELCGAVEGDEDEISRTRHCVIETALHLRPGFVWEVYPECGGSEYRVQIILEEILNQQLGIAEDERLRILRLGLDLNFLIWRSRQGAVPDGLIKRFGVHGVCLQAEETHVRTVWKATPAWFESLPEFIAGYLNILPSRRFDLGLREVHGFLRQLAQRHWDLVFRILRDPATARAAEGFRAARLDRKVFGCVEGDPAIQLRDLGTLPQTEDRDQAEESRIRPAVLAAAAAFLPEVFLTLFDRAPGEQALAFASHLDDFDPEVPWPPGQLEVFVDRVEAAGDPCKGLVAAARLGAWLAGRSVSEPGVFARIAESALARDGTRHLREIADRLSGPDPALARALRAEALRRAVAAGDAGECLDQLEDGPDLDAETRAAALRALGRAADEVTDEGLLARIARWQMRSDPAAALRTIDRIRSDPEEVSKLLGLLGGTVELRDKNDIRAWLGRVKALEAPSPEGKQRFEESVLGHAIELGIVCSPKSLRGVANLNDRISLLLKLAYRVAPRARDEMLSEAEALLQEIGNVFARGIACQKLLQFARNAGIEERQPPLLRQLLSYARLAGEPSFLMESEVLHFVVRGSSTKECEEMASLLWEVAGHLTHYDKPFLQARLLARAPAIWFICNRARGRETLAGLLERFSENLADVFSGVADIQIYLALLGRVQEAEVLAREFLALVSADHRADAADVLVKRLEEAGRDSDSYPERRGLYPKISSSPACQGLIQKLLPACSPRRRLDVQFELALLRGCGDPEGGRQALAAVLRDPAWEFPVRDLNLDARPWLACAAALGEPGAIRAAQAFSREPDGLRWKLGNLLAWAFLGTERRRDLLYELWTAAEAFGSYVR